ncbi:hypothetical protein EK904_008319 [Melospiza melodia maxima]|nr:hypothetical protein EK904_008319 [Melospiza melodia maxima]
MARRDELKRHYNLGQYWVEVEMEDLASFDEDLADYLYKQPTEHLQLLEEAAKEVADEVTRPRPSGEETLQDIQVMLRSDANAANIRSLKSDQMSHLVKIPGIVIAATPVRAKATRITIQCRSCRNTISNIAVRPGLEGYALPRKCNTEQAGRPRCPLDPYFIMPDKCKCVDFQVLKLQESPDAVPHGEMPRHLQLYCDRYLCDKVVPGNRVTIMGIYSIKKSAQSKNKGHYNVGVGIRSAYIRVVGIQVDTEGSGHSFSGSVTPQEEEELRRLAAMPNIYETIAKSIAPSIYGSTDIKKAIACLLFGGSRKRLPDGLTRRGDINLLMLGDPGTAKSQLLKFVEKCSPIGVYTSGKGSSAAGLTASVIRDPVSRNFFMEGGAMVLADGGVVCIDEFDKMREDDRVAIHEAMEQQTISIAKLEAIVRIAESLAKMRLQPFATEADVEEALRLFHVSTLDAAMSGSLSGAEGFTTQEDQEMLSRIEKQLKRRFAIGSQVSEHSIVQDFMRQKYPEHAIYKVLQLMMRRGEIQHRMQRKVLYRIK